MHDLHKHKRSQTFKYKAFDVGSVALTLKVFRKLGMVFHIL